MRRLLPVLLALTLSASSAAAQTVPPRAPSARQTPRPAAPRSPDRFAVRGYGMAGIQWLTAAETFDAVTGSASGPIYGGGLRVHVPGGIYLDAGAWRYRKDGERVFVTDTKDVFPLGIPTEVTMTPFELTAGWRFRNLLGPVTPHLGVGYTSLKYEETAEFAQSGDDVSERYGGFHVVGGAEVRLHRWVGLLAEAAWTSVADGLGDAGASKAFGEDNLGGTSLRLKVVVGR